MSIQHAFDASIRVLTGMWGQCYWMFTGTGYEAMGKDGKSLSCCICGRHTGVMLGGMLARWQHLSVMVFAGKEDM